MTNPIPEQAGNFSLQPINAIEAVSRAEIDQQITTAKRYPRNLAKVKADMRELATIDEETATSCFYSLPRGGKNIQGPSIRLAEIALSCYGNVRAGTRILEVVADGISPYVAIQAVCHDLEKNIAVMIEKRRRIVGKKSKGGIIDEDDINLAANAGSAIAFRDAMFKVIPGILLRPVYEAAKKVAIGDARTLSDRRQRAIDQFAKMGVSKERVLASIERKSVEEITLDDLETLLGAFTAIKEGTSSIDDVFPSAMQQPAPKETRKVEKPDFGDAQPTVPTPAVEAPQPAPRENAPLAPHAEKKSRRPSEAKRAKDILYESLTSDTVRGNFIEGLKLIEFPGVKADTELLSELTDLTAQAILDEGVDNVFERIRDVRWSQNMK